LPLLLRLEIYKAVDRAVVFRKVPRKQKLLNILYVALNLLGPDAQKETKRYSIKLCNQLP
jgi:hypothetical protein